MIFLIFLMFILGMVMIVIETLTPFGISAALGIALIVGSCYLAVHNFGAEAGTMYSLMAFVISSGLAYFMMRNGIKFLRLNPPKRTKTSEVAARADTSEPAPGDLARVVQPLRPTGTVEWNGRRFAARSINVQDELAVGDQVVVREKDSIYFIVERAPTDPS